MLGDRLLPLPALQDKVGFKHTKIYALIREDKFPPGKLIFGKRLWRESEIDAWIERIWEDEEHDQGNKQESPTLDAPVKAKPLPDTAVTVPPTLVSVYWPSSYLLERYGISRTSLYRWINTKGFPAPAMPGGHGSQSRWHADDVLAWEAKIRNGKVSRSSSE